LEQTRRGIFAADTVIQVIGKECQGDANYQCGYQEQDKQRLLADGRAGYSGGI
jgi:hypothetical protein